MYILTSRSTSSAAEIFAHVLKSHGRATLIGGRTAGRVLRSKYFRLPDAGFLQIPLQAYQGIAGERLEGSGIRPDVPVPAPGLTELRRGDDPVLEKAIAQAREKLATAPLSLRTGYSGAQALAAAM